MKFVISNTLKVEKGYGEKLMERFHKMGDVENAPGFMQLNLLQVKNTDEYDEFVIWSQWESKEAHEEWTKTEQFRDTHRGPRSKEIIDSNIVFYDVVAERELGALEEKRQDAI